MKKSRSEFGLVSVLIIAIGWTACAQAQAQQLLHQSDFTYLGSFRLPSGNYGMTDGTFDYSNCQGSGIVYNDPVIGKTLFVSGYLSAGYVSSTPSVAQVKIPELLDLNLVGIDSLAVATVVQGFADPSNGIGDQVLDDRGGSVALVPYGNKLIGTQNVAYDASCSQSKSAWVAPLDFSQASQATGPYAFTSAVGPRFLGGGYMTLIPAEWQSALGGKVVSGNGPWSIIGCGSPGPSLHVIDADMLVSQPSVGTSILSTALLYYQDDIHSSLGAWNSNDPNQVINGKKVPGVTVTDPHGRGTFTIAYNDNSMRIGGVLFADGTRSVLFFGHKGLGAYCYGTGGADGECHDPESDSKGDHCYPYTEFVWAYDVSDLIAAKNGQKNPWDVLPYTGWIPAIPGDDNGGSALSVAWDPKTRRAYILQGCAWGANCDPLVHAFKVDTPASSFVNPGIRLSQIRKQLNITNSGGEIVIRHPSLKSVRISDISGRTVADLTGHCANAIVRWNTSKLSAGLYVVRVQIGIEIVMSRFTVMK